MSNKKDFSKYYLYAVIIVASTTSFCFQGSRGLYESTEGRYAQCSLEMLSSGNYLVPTLNHVPHWTKPPLTYWVIASGIKILGKNTWGARIGNSVAFLISVIMIYLLANLFWNRTVALYAGLIYATSPLAIAGANSLSTDQLLTMWELMTVLFYWLFLRYGSVKWIIITGASTGFAFLTKGPPGLLTILVIIVFHFIEGKNIRRAGLLPVTGGFITFCITGLSWYVYSVINNPHLLDYFLGEEVYARIFSEEFRRNPRWYAPLYIYGLPLLFGGGGWIFFLRRYR
jgi:4-amino-4-deoxy-L-arabinose transferase